MSDFRARALDRRALAGRHAAAGARILAVLPHETTMADPVGRLYRLTGGDGWLFRSCSTATRVAVGLDAGRFWELVVAAVAALG